MTTLSHHLPALQVIVPMLSAPLVMLLKPSGLARAAAVAASLFAFVIAIAMTMGVLDGNIYTYRMGSWPAPYGIELTVDRFSALLLLIVTGASTLALLAGQRSLPVEGRFARLNAELAGFRDRGEHLCGLQPGLGGDASAQQTGATNLVLLDEGRLEAVVVRIEGGCVSGGATADDHNVVHESSGSIGSGVENSPSRRIRFWCDTLAVPMQTRFLLVAAIVTALIILIASAVWLMVVVS